MKKKIYFLFCILFIIVVCISTFLMKKEKENEISKTETNIPKGIGIHISGIPSEHEFQLIKQAGFKYARFDLAWTLIENDKGEYDFDNSGFDLLVQRMSKYDIKPYFILAYSNSLYEKKRSIVTEDGRKAFSEFVNEATKRYKGKNAIWEIWNEPNLPYYWQDQPSFNEYVKLVETIAPIIKNNDSSGVVLGPAVSGISGESLDWFEQVFQQGILNQIDAVSVHLYRYTAPETVSVDYPNLSSLIGKYTNHDVPIISGEWGYYVENSSDKENAELLQAQNIVRMLLVNTINDIPLSIVYEWKNSGIDIENKHDNYGLFWSEGKPKKSYDALKVYAEVLDEYSFEKRIHIGQPNDYILKFANAKGKEILVFWTTDGEHNTSINYPSGKGELVAMLGNKKEIIWNNKQINLSLSQSPSYIIID
ncbi:cellulase family glycosylhydrolase [Niallia taxi]|uniref:cellulase family glycosylhydrolase n=1 Tax=Niallia taxi TaxID=2499688 RepID=UPI0015F773A7|nr:cellulase family glycosylhydrolase [Niallia taxi]MED3964062.1 cellulase family glycosylhydrolase [Niallia taxi]